MVAKAGCGGISRPAVLWEALCCRQGCSRRLPVPLGPQALACGALLIRGEGLARAWGRPSLPPGRLTECVLCGPQTFPGLLGSLGKCLPPPASGREGAGGLGLWMWVGLWGSLCSHLRHLRHRGL